MTADLRKRLSATRLSAVERAIVMIGSVSATTLLFVELFGSGS